MGALGPQNVKDEGLGHATVTKQELSLWVCCFEVNHGNKNYSRPSMVVIQDPFCPGFCQFCPRICGIFAFPSIRTRPQSVSRTWPQSPFISEEIDTILNQIHQIINCWARFVVELLWVSGLLHSFVEWCPPEKDHCPRLREFFGPFFMNASWSKHVFVDFIKISRNIVDHWIFGVQFRGGQFCPVPTNNYTLWSILQIFNECGH